MERVAHVAAAGFLSHYLSGSLPYVWCYIAKYNMLSALLNKIFPSFVLQQLSPFGCILKKCKVTLSQSPRSHSSLPHFLLLWSLVSSILPLVIPGFLNSSLCDPWFPQFLPLWSLVSSIPPLVIPGFLNSSTCDPWFPQFLPLWSLVFSILPLVIPGFLNSSPCDPWFFLNSSLCDPWFFLNSSPSLIYHLVIIQFMKLNYFINCSEMKRRQSYFNRS